MKMVRRLIMLFMAIVALSACSQKDAQVKKTEIGQPDPTTGIREAEFTWSKEIGQGVTFHFQPTDSLKLKAPKMLNQLVQVFMIVREVLNDPRPDSINFYCYQDQEALKLYTGRDNIFHIGNKFYYGYGSPYGGDIAQYVMEKLPGGGTQFNFLRDGMLTFLDFSGRNYHHATNNFLQDGSLDPVKALSDNALYDKMTGLQKMIESASLYAFMTTYQGYPKMMELYYKKSDFATALKEVLGITVEQLQKDWEAYLPEHTNEKEAEREKAAATGGHS